MQIMVQGYGFLSFAKIFGDKYKKKLMDSGPRLDAAKPASKRVVQKATGELTGNEIAVKINSLAKSKNKEKEDATNDYVSTRKETKNN